MLLCFYSVDTIEQGLQEKRKLSFVYFDLDENHKKVYRKDEKEYIVNPVALVFVEDNYYLMCYSEKYEAITSYRVDRMERVRVLDQSVCAAALLPEEKIAAFTEQMFKMFGGEPEKVTLRFGDNLIGIIYDKFGEDTKMTRLDDETCVAEVTVQISPTFWGWLFQFCGEMQLIGPKDIVDTYQALLEEASKQGGTHYD